MEEYITLGHTDWLTLIYRALVMPCHLRSQIFSIVTLLWSFSFLSRNSQDNSHVSQMFIHFYAHLKTMFYFRWHNPPWGAHWAQGGSWRVLSLGRAICAHKIRAAIVCVCLLAPPLLLMWYNKSDSHKPQRNKMVPTTDLLWQANRVKILKKSFSK